ncbi:MAG: L-lysine 6-transaminase [Planctomycetota bacterium]
MKNGNMDPGLVRDALAKHMLVDGFRLVVDLEKSKGSWLVDGETGKTYLDFYTFFASSPLGFNHPRLTEPDFLYELGRAAVHKPANSDVQTVEMAAFVDAFSRIAMPEELPHLFFVEGGALAVENAMKAAFDWKVRKNMERGVEGGGSKILHFREAFHGRSGYTMSVTNTDPVKIMHFPKFDWPRVTNPKLSFPLTEASLAETKAAEATAIAEIEQAFADHPDEIAGILIEPIQCEGGDNHFRPEFICELRRIADEREALLIFDEVQTGLGATGRMWAFEHFDVVPDIVCFAKKVQVGGILCSRRIEEVKDHVFELSSRINSTWGGGLVDMVRSTRILEVIRDEGLVANAAEMGERFLTGVGELAAEFTGTVTNPRGQGLVVAFDLPTKELRDRYVTACFDAGLIILTCGEKSVRFRPALNVTADEIDEGLKRLRAALEGVLATAS